ncbi:hypothetical protein P691DRAFT_768220 [Macrolepiota fuliginosa MF-IS2]|uniref:Uncharacterized protein n=1 Tax=Macrolepiota fuliginosa MF-IS2 TaxID=1400762 RepID=A0A9P5WWC1_9AGAR|nr:hypothetical protein P691DRAFT_768220 [Macrolepiota fuliginosa MF-IS2]
MYHEWDQIYNPVIKFRACLPVFPDDTTQQPQPEAQKRTPLPIKQLLILVVTLIAEPLTNSIIRSFGNPLTPANDGGRGLADGDTPEDSRFYSQFLVRTYFIDRVQ